MSKTELERHLLHGLEKLDQEIRAKQLQQDQVIQNLTSTVNGHTAEIQQLNEFYKSLEPLLQRLNAILEKVR